jgi:methylthioribulose-1-phosphate dehydratase
MRESFEQTAWQLVALAKELHARGWLLGTSGNLSAVVNREPLRLAITPSGADKGQLSYEEILLIDEHAKLPAEQRQISGKPSDESLLHIAIVKAKGASAVVHTHSTWATLLSDLNGDAGGMNIQGYEMLKGLRGVTTHQHRELIPIVNNSQDMVALSSALNKVLADASEAHAVLIRRHGLYTWGSDLKEAKRHVEILEFLFEVIGRTKAMDNRSGRNE